MIKFNILVAENTDAIRELAKSTILKNCVNIHLEAVADKQQIKKELNLFSPEMIIVSDNLDLSCKKFLKWLENHPELSKRQYIRVKTENFKRLIPPDHIKSSFSLSGMSFWIVVATKAAEKRRLERLDTHDSVLLSSGEESVQGNLVNIAEGGALCLCPRQKSNPPIAEKVTIDINSAEHSIMSGVPGFPVRIQLVKPELHYGTVHIAVKFSDLTTEQTSQLNAYLELQKKCSAEEK